MFLPQQDIFYISKSEKFFFSLAVIMYFMFYGVLAVSLYLGLPNSYISAGVKLVPTAIALVLFFRSFMNREFGRLGFPVVLLLIYIVYLSVLILLFNPEVRNDSIGYMEYGKLYTIYIFLSNSVLTFALFFMPQNRFFYLAERPSLIFIPSLISAALIFFLFRGMFFDGSTPMLMESLGINRATTKLPVALICIISWYYCIFGDKLYKFIFGVLALAIGFVLLSKSSSQSLLLSTFAAFSVGVIFSFRSIKTFLRMVVFCVLGFVAFVMLIMTSAGMQRLAMLADIDLMYTYGGGDTSRIDLLNYGWTLFLQSPIIGGRPFLPDGGYTHFYSMDVLMAAGILGILLLFALWFADWRVILRSLFWGWLPLKYVWVLMLYVYDISQASFHGSSLSPMSYGFALMLTIYVLYDRYMGPLPQIKK